jgi:hypothetical protein
LAALTPVRRDKRAAANFMVATRNYKNEINQFCREKEREVEL